MTTDIIDIESLNEVHAVSAPTALARQDVQNRKAESIIDAIKTKRYPVCEQTLPLTSENYHKNATACRPCAIQRSRDYYANNKAYCTARNAVYREKNREALNAYHRTPEAKAKKNARQRRYRSENVRAYREYGRIKYRKAAAASLVRTKRWYAAHPEAAALHALNKNLKRRGVPMNADARRYAAVLRHDPCSYCGGRSKEVDHIVPVARGGDSSFENLTAACGPCNRLKNRKPLLHFMLEVASV